jgi:hypothetical protein
MKMQPEDTTPEWGAKVNDRTWYSRKDVPTWVAKGRIKKWNEPGLVVWNRERGQIVRLYPKHALDVLARVRTTFDWQQDGTTIGEPVTEYVPGTPPFSGPTILTNTMTLTPEQTQTVLGLLESSEAELRTLAESQEQQMQEALGKVYELIFRTARAKEAATVDLSARQLPWTYDPREEIWMCDLPPNCGTISVAKFGLSFQACIERPHKHKKVHPRLMTFEDALAWVEAELGLAAQEDDQPQVEPMEPSRISLTTLTMKQRRKLARFWIDPASLEPEQVTYRAIITVEHEATNWWAVELSFGEKKRYAIDYPTAQQVMQRLNLDANQVNATEIGSIFRIKSLLKYASATVAFDRAREVWTRSSIGRALKDKTVLRAAYGIVEDETGYEEWEAWEGEWPGRKQDRATHLAELAFRLTLIHALDVEGYRAYRGLPERLISNEKLVRLMHEQRATLPHIPLSAGEESQHWLKEHGHT